MDAARIIPTPTPAMGRQKEGATDAPDHHPSTRRHGGRGRPGRAGPSPSAANRGRRGHHGRAWITTRGRSHGRMGRARISTPPPPPWRKGRGGAVPDHPQRQHAAAEGTPWTCRITLSPAPASVAEGTPWTCRDHHQCPHGTGTPWTPTDSLPPFVRRYDLYFLLRLLRQFPSIKKRPQWADFLVSYINLIIIPVYPDV